VYIAPEVIAERIEQLRARGVRENLEEIARGQLTVEVIMAQADREARGQSLTRSEQRSESDEKLRLRYMGADPAIVRAFEAPVYLPPGKRSNPKGKRVRRGKVYGWNPFSRERMD
jgi:hypothetical protein